MPTMLALHDLTLAIANAATLERAGAAGLSRAGVVSPVMGVAGTVTCHWRGNGPNDFGPGDAFDFTQANWWIPGPGLDMGRLLDGDWSLQNYIENASPCSVGGQARFTNLLWRCATPCGDTWLVSDPVPMLGSGTIFVQSVP